MKDDLNTWNMKNKKSTNFLDLWLLIFEMDPGNLSRPDGSDYKGDLKQKSLKSFGIRLFLMSGDETRTGNVLMINKAASLNGLV